MIDGGVHAGPNAVFSFHREGYSRFSFSARDTWSSLSWSGFRHAAWRFLRTGIDEHLRSLSKGKFVRDVQKIVPAIQEDDLEPARPGIRAQAIDESGALVDDFAFAQSDGILHVCNAPSPAATSSLEIAKLIVDRIS
jgi:L-2-hydroxyglutarate oxidase